MKYDAEKTEKIKQCDELRQKFLDAVKDNPDFKIYFLRNDNFKPATAED